VTSAPERAGAGAAPATAPVLEFAVLGARYEPHAAAPTLVFTLGVTEAAGREVFTVALSAQIHLEPAKRRYDRDARERLQDLFGAPERWPATMGSLVWARADVLVPSFTGATTFDLALPCTYDLEVAASKYLHTLADGEAPLAFHLSGSILFPDDGGRMRVAQVPWTTSASHLMPVSLWREMMDRHYPHGVWVRLHEDTAERLRRSAADRGLPSLDAAVLDLLEGGGA